MSERRGRLAAVQPPGPRRQAEADANPAGAREQSEYRLDRLFALSQDLLCAFGFDGYLKRVNPAFLETLGFTIEELLPQPHVELIHPDDRAAVLAELERLAGGLPSAAHEVRYRCKDGSYRHLHWYAAPSLPEQVIYAVGRDITRRKRIEAEETQLERQRAKDQLWKAQEELQREVEHRAHAEEERNDAQLQVRQAQEGLELLVDERTADLVTANRTLQVDIGDLKRAQEEIDKLNQDLQRRAAELDVANRELEAFSYSVSHDLRAPLRSIAGFSQALLEDYADTLDERGKGHLERVCTAAQRMAELIDDLLILSSVTRSQMTYERIDLSALAKIIAAELQQTQPGRPVEFFIEEGLLDDGDSHLLRIALENLLGNAWKFTSRHPSARIQFGASGQRSHTPVYFVRDDGVGFDMTYYSDRVFGAFQRLHGTAEFPGTGIGLATVQRIIHRHGGRVWGEGSPEQGATFYFTLRPQEKG